MKDIVKFRALIGIAQADGEFDDSEKEFIRRLAHLEGMSVQELKELLKKGDKTSSLVKDLSFDDKIEILTYTVQLMKIDGKVLMSEITFCERVAKTLGFEEKSIGFLSGIIEGNPEFAPDVGRVKHRMRNYLIEEY